MRYASQPSLITTRLCPTISSPKAWEGLGETTAPRISKQSIGGAIWKRVLEDWEADDPLCTPWLKSAAIHVPK